MAEPLIPYVSLPELQLGFLRHVPVLGALADPGQPPSLKPFGILVALGVYVGARLAMRHARERGLAEAQMNELITWTVGAGFVFGHVLDAIFYHPQRVVQNPLYLLALWNGLSSFGGFAGAISGALLWSWRRHVPILPFCEVICSAFPLAWVFGRAGCSVVHDHPGRLSDAWFAVRYPLASGYVGRFDLGLYECLLTIPLALGFAIAWRRGPRPVGFFIGWMCVLYAPVRFCLDFLREHEGGGLAGADPRYAGLTPAQWASFGLLGLGVYFLRTMAARDSTSQAAASAARGAAGAPLA